MSTFQEIVKDSEATRHEVYFLGVPFRDKKGRKKYRLHGAPSPKSEQADAEAELRQLRNEERKERAKRLADIVHSGGIDQCEQMGVSIAELIEEPEHTSVADGGLPVMMNLVRKISE